MDSTQRRAIIIVVEGIEHQLKSIKSLLATVGVAEHRPAPNLVKEPSMGYTSKEEDQHLDAVLAVENDREAFLADLFAEANKGGNE